MSRLIQRCERKTRVTFGLFFERKSLPGAGYCFDCDERGKVLESELNPTARESLADARSNPEYHAPEIQRYENRYWEPAKIRCDCGATVEAYPDAGYYGAFDCDECDRWYNLSGQALNSPSMWEERLEEDY